MINNTEVRMKLFSLLLIIILTILTLGSTAAQEEYTSNFRFISIKDSVFNDGSVTESVIQIPVSVEVNGNSRLSWHLLVLPAVLLLLNIPLFIGLYSIVNKRKNEKKISEKIINNEGVFVEISKVGMNMQRKTSDESEERFNRIKFNEKSRQTGFTGQIITGSKGTSIIDQIRSFDPAMRTKTQRVSFAKQVGIGSGELELAANLSKFNNKYATKEF